MIRRRKTPQPKACWTTAFPPTKKAREPKPKRTTKRAKENRVYSRKARNFVAAKGLSPTEWFCPVAFKIKGIFIRVEQVHHKRGRLGSLLLDERQWLAVSAWGHVWIDANREEARKHGWLAQRGEWHKQNETEP